MFVKLIMHHLSRFCERIADRVFPELVQSVADGVEGLVQLGAKREQLQLHVKVENELEVEWNVDDGVEKPKRQASRPGKNPGHCHNQSDRGQQHREEDGVVVFGRSVTAHSPLGAHLRAQNFLLKWTKIIILR